MRAFRRGQTGLQSRRRCRASAGTCIQLWSPGRLPASLTCKAPATAAVRSGASPRNMVPKLPPAVAAGTTGSARQHPWLRGRRGSGPSLSAPGRRADGLGKRRGSEAGREGGRPHARPHYQGRPVVSSEGGCATCRVQGKRSFSLPAEQTVC